MSDNLEATELSNDIRERAELIVTLQEYLVGQPGTQADKAKQLGITQPRLNALLKNKVEKFSLDALVNIAAKAGVRVNLQLQRIAKPLKSPPTILNTFQVGPFFSPMPDELGYLDSTQSSKVFLNLLRCDVTSAGISPSNIVFSLNTTTKDGGIDAKVEVECASSSFLDNGNVHFQVKSGSSFKPWYASCLKRELFGKSNARPSKKALGDAVKHCLDNGHTYCLVTFGHDLLPKEHTKTINYLIEYFQACGYRNPKVKVLGQGQLIGEIEKYPSLCLELKGLSVDGAQPIEYWKNNAQMQLPLFKGEPQNKFIDEIQDLIRSNSVQHIRVIGEPGIGKTRLILESVSDQFIAPTVVYISSGEEFQKSKLFKEILRVDRNFSATLVIDDCDSRDRTSIWSALKGNSRIKLITIDHGPEDSDDSSMKTIHCPLLPNEQIEEILASYLDKKYDLRNWAEMCDGSPRVAHAVGENLAKNSSDVLKTPADVPIWERFIIGHKPINSVDAEQYRIVLRHLALFQKFGFENPVDEEARHICTLVQKVDSSISWGKFQTIVLHYKNKRILQGNTTLYFVPKALHIHLWVDYWEQHGRGFKFQDIYEELPSGLRNWFLQLFIYAHDVEPAKKVVKNILSEDGPFSDVSFFKSKTGLKFISVLAEADPASTLRLIERTLEEWSHEDIYKLNEGRQYLVWALEKISVWKNLFARSVDVLTRLALAENSNYGNNSTGILLSLFQIGRGWAPTQAPPEMRFPILQEFVRSEDSAKRELGFKMCETWLDTHGGMRTIGSEYQGIRPTIKFWAPKVWGEIFDCWRDVLKFLFDEMKGFDIENKNKAANVLVHAAFDLIDTNAVTDQIHDILFELANDEDISKKGLTNFVIRMLNRRDRKLESSLLEKINELDNMLTGTSLIDRITRFVLNTNWEEHYGINDGDNSESDRRVNELAKEYMADTEHFDKYALSLLKASGLKLPQFAYECGKQATENLLDEKLLNLIKDNVEYINSEYLGGYLSGIRELDEDRWESLIVLLLRDVNTRDLAINCITRSGLNDSLIHLMLNMYKKEEISSSAFFNFYYKRENSGVSFDAVREIIHTLLQYPDDTSVSVAIEILYVKYIEDEINPLPEELVLNALIAPPIKIYTQEAMYDYHWEKIANVYLKEYPHRSMELLGSIFDKILSGAQYYSYSFLRKTAAKIIKSEPDLSWKLVSRMLEDNDAASFHLMYWFDSDNIEEGEENKSLASYFPIDKVMKWVGEDEKIRKNKIIEILPKTLELQNGGYLTREFIDKFCNDKKTTGRLIVHFWAGSWSGNTSAYLSGKRDIARKWFSEIESARIQKWLSYYMDWLSERIERELIEEEREF